MSKVPKPTAKINFGQLATSALDHMMVRSGHDISPKCCAVHEQAVASAKDKPGWTLDPNDIHDPECWRFTASVLRLADQVLATFAPKPKVATETEFSGPRLVVPGLLVQPPDAPRKSKIPER